MDSSRSIDFAKTASIDMMALNNKVVNMRQTVKRTKVQVINKLTKNISKLKKKRGSEEQRQQNLQKAERLIEEIDSIKKLKSDKVSKYALANTTTFSDVSKVSTSAGPRALARLADHPLLTKVVKDFRSQHTDWRDLAAYLLVKQTGRRFKTKKQKQTKLARSVENINASETMTKAYIQNKFGQEALKKAEEKFEKKRKRAKGDPPANEEAIGNEHSEAKGKRLRLDSDGDLSGDPVEQSQLIHGDTDGVVNTKDSILEDDKLEQDLIGVTCNFQSDGEVDNENVITGNSDSEHSGEESDTSKDKNIVEDESDSDSDADNSTNLKVKNEETSDKPNVKSALPKEKVSKNKSKQEPVEKVQAKRRKECVVKEFDLDSKGSKTLDVSDGESSSELESDEQESNDSEHETSQDSSQVKKLKKKAEKKSDVPQFLLKDGSGSSSAVINDPFFGGSDDDNDVGQGRSRGYDTDPDIADLIDDEGFEDGGEFTKGKAKSMFHNPFSRELEGEESYSGGSSYRKSERAGRGGFRGRRDGEQRRGGGGGWRDGAQGRGRGQYRDGDQRRGGRGGWRGAGSRGRGGWSEGGSRGRGGRGGGNRGGHAHDRFPSGDRASQPSQHRTERRDLSRNTGSTKDSGPPPKHAEKLHPSWEAKKKKAEQSGIVAFQGKKITFDD